MELLHPVTHFPAAIQETAICQRKDLIALHFSSGVVSCHRFNGSLVCYLVKPSNVKTLPPCTGIEWRPDGRFVTLKFEDGSLRLYNIESGGLLDETFGTSSTTRLQWTQESDLSASGPEFPQVSFWP